MYVFVPDNNQGDFQQANFGCFDRSFDYRLIIPKGKFRSSRVGDRREEGKFPKGVTTGTLSFYRLFYIAT